MGAAGPTPNLVGGLRKGRIVVRLIDGSKIIGKAHRWNRTDTSYDLIIVGRLDRGQVDRRYVIPESSVVWTTEEP